MDVALLGAGRLFGLGGWLTVGAFRAQEAGSAISVSVVPRALALIRCWCGEGGLLLAPFMRESYLYINLVEKHNNQ